MNKVLGNKKALALFTLPAIILFTLLAIVPIIWSLFYSFFSGMPGVNFQFCGLDNFKQFFTDTNVHQGFLRNIKYDRAGRNRICTGYAD